MVIAGIFSVAGLVAGALGQDCIHAINGREKIYAARAGGVLMLSAGTVSILCAGDFGFRESLFGHPIQYQLGYILQIKFDPKGGLLKCKSVCIVEMKLCADINATRNSLYMKNLYINQMGL